MSILKNKYRRLCDYLSFDNYFRFNIKKSSINNEEINCLLENINNIESFNKNLIKLFNIDSNKILDFINYWDSSFNREKKTKDNLIYLIKNFLSLSENKLIQFLDEQSIFNHISRYFVNDFNQENKNKITFDEIYNIIEETIKFADYNLYFFVYFIFCQYKFPIGNPPNLDKLDTNKTYEKVIKLLKNNITKEKILNSNKAMAILDYLYNHLDLDIVVDDFINELFNNNKVDNLLQILLTAKYLNSFVSLDGYGAIKKFFADIKKEKDLKEKLLEIYYDTKYEKYKTNYKYLIKDRYIEDRYIVEVILDFYYDKTIAKIKTNTDINNDAKNIEEKASLLKSELEKYSEKEIKYSIETSSIEIISANQIINFIEMLRNDYPIFYEKYYTKNFELFRNTKLNNF